MSSPRVQKIFEAMPDQIRKTGKYDVDFREVVRWQGRDASGKDAAVIDFTDAAWATANKRAILVAEPAADKDSTDALRTQSHASGYFIDGSVRFQLYMETPAGWTDDHAQFLRDVVHHLRGQLGAPVQLKLTANGTEPTVDGVNGAGATAATSDAEWMLPYGMVYPGGV